jgi:hypothetical protein
MPLCWPMAGSGDSEGSPDEARDALGLWRAFHDSTDAMARLEETSAATVDFRSGSRPASRLLGSRTFCHRSRLGEQQSSARPTAASGTDPVKPQPLR